MAGTLGLVHEQAPAPGPTGPTVSVDVVDDRGTPLAGARVRTDEGSATTDAAGRAAVPLSRDGYAHVEASGHGERTLRLHAAEASRAVLPASGFDTVTLRFGGDVMMGRRFYEPSASGPALLTEASTVEDHRRLLDGITPLLQDADLTAVNLETPLVAKPYWPEGAKRPGGFNPTKEIAFASSTKTAQALRDAGVDVVSLANNHVNDGGAAGTASTLEALDDAGVRHFGAGRTEDEAWTPLEVPVRGRTVAYVGCTTVDGLPSPHPYVAQGSSGGAARCSEGRLRRTVERQRAAGHDVVVMIHGAVEYERQQRPVIRRLTQVAAEAGATAVMNGHPHVVGGLTTQSGAVVAESLGNLLFDQHLWSTFPTYLVRVDLHDGRPVHTQADPLVIDRYAPRPATTALADAVGRIAAGSVATTANADATGTTIGSALLEPRPRAVQLTPGVPTSLAPGWQLAGRPDGILAGSDLLFGSGRFEADARSGSGPALWTLGANTRRTNAAACAPTPSEAVAQHGVELVRSPLSTQDAFVTPEHRIPVKAGQRLTFVAAVRHASPGSRATLAWYAGAEGPSSATTEVTVPPSSSDADDCRQVRVDVTAPAGTTFVQPALRLLPPESSVRGSRLAVDDVSLVRWGEEGGSSARFDTVLAERATAVTLQQVTPTAATEPTVLRATSSPVTALAGATEPSLSRTEETERP
ncbi:CapA family protein [Arsenicicoccus bolidensis]|uniref:CapA family protein n=1 Tax=Arsenicicoccus bolidensis TaxID=229480 RepID=UPI0003FD8387|nr:CapA family protein [Arsenicicoccus bolidensis]